MIKLTLTEKGGEPKVLTFDKDEITIGRVSGNDIVLPKGNVSKRHSRLTMRGGQMEIADLKSTNGTYVNGRKIGGPTALAPTDRVYVGDFLISLDPGAGTGVSPNDAGGAASAHGSGAEGLGMGAGTTSSARRLSVPPPPPPPRSGGSSAARLPGDEEETGSGDDEEEMALAARPPRAGQMPIPPPPPPPAPKRAPTPLASRGLGAGPDEEPRAASHEGPGGHDEDTGAVGLFAHSRRPDDELEGAANRRFQTGNRPGIAVPAAPPPAAPSPGFGADRAGPAAVAAASPEALTGAAPGLEALLADTAVTQIILTGPDAALVDRGAGLELHAGSLGDANGIADVLWRYANTAYPPPAPDNPVVDVRLPDGTRVAAAFPPAAPGGLVAAIRRPTLPERNLADLVPGGDKDVEALLSALVVARRNVLVTGDVAAISALLGALASVIPAERRVVAVGASARGRSGWIDLAPTPDMAGLLRVAAALRPEHVMLGEIAGVESAELALLSARGQEGVVAALPGRAGADALKRLAALAAPALGSGASAAALIAEAFDAVVTVVAASDGRARIVEVAEPRATGGEVSAEVALAFSGGDAGRRGSGEGSLEGRGVSGSLAAALAAAGSPVPSAVAAE